MGQPYQKPSPPAHHGATRPTPDVSAPAMRADELRERRHEHHRCGDCGNPLGPYADTRCLTCGLANAYGRRPEPAA